MDFREPRFWKVSELVLLATLLGVQSCAVVRASTPSPGTLQVAKDPSAIYNSPQALFNKAATLIKDGHYSQAASLLRSGIKRFPGQPGFHHYLGYALWKLDEMDRARAEFERAHALDPKNAYTCYFLARIAASSGQLDQAINYYKEVLKLGPAIYDTHQRLGQAYLDKGNFEEARSMIQKALAKTPWNGSLYYQLGQIDQREHHLAQARREFAASSRLKNGAQKYIQQLLDLKKAVGSHQTEQVQQIQAELLKEDFPDPEMYDSIGVLLGQGGFYSLAVEPLERSVKLAPKSYQFSYDLGLTLFKLGRLQEAEAQLKNALALQPKSPQVNKLLGLIYVNENRNSKAIARLRAANESAPYDTRVEALLAQQYLVGHYVAQAITSLNSAIRHDPRNDALRLLLIEAYEGQHDFQKALKLAQDSATVFPQNARFVYEEGQQLANIGNYKKALPFAEKAIELDPTLTEAYNLMGDILSRSGQYQPALTNFRKARNISPDNKVALKGIAESLLRMGRYPEALSELKSAIAIHPEYDQLYFDLMQVYMRMGRRNDAVQAQANFRKFHARAVAQRNARAPRDYKPAAGPGSH